MNILHIDEQRTWRGGEQQASYLMRGLVKRGHTCVLAGRPDTPFTNTGHGGAEIPQVMAPFRGEIDLWTARTLAQAVKHYDIDILHAHTSHAHTAACLACRLAGRGKVVVHRRVDFPPKAKIINRWKYRLPDHYIAVCQRVAEVMEAFGTPASKISVVHSSIDLARFDVDPIGRGALGIPEGIPLLGNVAALVGHKDQANLLAAMPRVLKAIPELRLVIAGEGELRPALEKQIAELGIGHCVTLLGNRDDVPRILRTLDAFVLSSYAEGIGGCTIEALACRLPVVATAAGGVGEVIENEVTGLLVPVRDADALAEAIIRLFKEEALAKQLAAKGEARVHEQFTVETLVDKTIRVYESLLA